MRYLSALLLISMCSAAEPTVPEGAVAVVLSSERTVSVVVLEAMRHEVEVLVAPSGVALVWPNADQAAANSYPRLAMMNLLGDCSVTPATSQRGPAYPVLGKTHVVDGQVLPIADLQCDAVHKVVDRNLRVAPESQKEQLFARALGRVMAHELYHILLRTERHGATGLARPAQTSEELTRVHSSFAASEEQLLAQAASSAELASESGR